MALAGILVIHHFDLQIALLDEEEVGELHSFKYSLLDECVNKIPWHLSNSLNSACNNATFDMAT